MAEPENGEKPEQPVVISERTMVPLAILCSVCLAILGAYMWLDGRFDHMTLDFTTMRSEQASSISELKSSQATAISELTATQTTSMTKLDDRLSDVQEDVDLMQRVLSDRLTKSEFESYMNLFFARNPSLTRP